MCNTGKSFGQKMHCGRVCESILGRLGGVGWCCRGHRVGRWPAGPEAGWRRGLLRPSACRATRCATAVFPPACGAGLQNGRRWRAKRALRQPETGPVAWPCGGVAPGRRRAPLCRRPSGGAVATVCRRGGASGASLLQLFCRRMQIFPEKVLAFRKK